MSAAATMLVLALSLLVVGSGEVVAHSGDWIDSAWTTSAPAVDGMLSPGEWANASAVDLSTVAGNLLPAFLLAANDATNLYLAYDAVGDVSLDADDHASVSFDTYNDATANPDHEDQFHWGPGAGSGQEHWITGGFMWFIEDSPFDAGLPNHAGLASAYGYGASDLEPAFHMMYEICIPLALLDVTPGEVIGLLGASSPSPGVSDNGMSTYSTWPNYLTTLPPFEAWGDLRLGKPPQTDDLTLDPPSLAVTTGTMTNVTRDLRVTNRGTRNDTYDIDAFSPWSFSFLNESGAPLPDTDGDSIPDTGNVTPGGTVNVTVRLEVTMGSGCSDSSIFALSSNDLAVWGMAIVRTCIPDVLLEPPHNATGLDTDIPPNGLYDYLVVRVGVRVNNPGGYILRAWLFDGSQTFIIARAYRYTYLLQGRQEVDLSMPGWDILESGEDGPYFVVIQIFDATDVFLDEDTFTTDPFTSTEFDRAPVEFAPPHSDAGVDADSPPDGFYDTLDVFANVDVKTPGTYTFLGWLFDPLANLISNSITKESLATGGASVTLEFVGRDIFFSGQDGPYTVYLEAYSETVLLDLDVHTTRAYAFAEFQPLPAAFNPPHRDEVVDLTVPPDGLYDYLYVHASVSVAHAGRFRVEGTLMDLAMVYSIDSTYTYASLDVGVHDVTLRFGGFAIRESGLAGPYGVLLTLMDSVGYLGMDTHVTQAYDPTDFSPRGAGFSPPHADALVDTDVPPDGLANQLAIEVGVDVYVAGDYLVTGALTDGSGYLPIASASQNQTLAPGYATFNLTYGAEDIVRAGFDGPYSVELTLFDSYGRFLDLSYHITDSHGVDEFQPPDETSPASVAQSGFYWRNRAPLDIAFTADDPVPGDGLAGVTLHYRHSADNASWSPWTAFATKPVSGGTASGTIGFSFPDGIGYYEFQAVATDLAGNAEALGAAEARVAFRPLASLALTPPSAPLTAGGQTTISVEVRGTDGQPAILESPLVVDLAAFSPDGEFRQVGGSTAIASVTIPAGQSEASFDYYDTRAGTWAVLASSAETSRVEGEAVVSAASPASVVVDPPSAVIQVGAGSTFSALVFDAFGNAIPGASVTWSVGGSVGTISASGAFTAGTRAASGTVIATLGALQASATVTLVPGPAAAVRISPPGATIRSGTGLNLTAFVLDAYGNLVDVDDVSWTVSGPGSLSAASGVRTTLSTTAAGTVTVTATRGALSATATFVSTAAAAPETGIQPVAAGGLAMAALVGGLALGFALARVLRKRGGPEEAKAPESPPPAEEPPKSDGPPPG